MGENKMLEIIFIIIIFLVLIYFDVRLAITPLLNKVNEIYNYKAELIKLRDIGVLGDTELEKAIELYQSKYASKGDFEQYIRYVKILNELNKMGYFNDEERSERLNKLKEYYKIS